MVSFTGLHILATTITASMLVTTSLANFHILGCRYRPDPVDGIAGFGVGVSLAPY